MAPTAYKRLLLRGIKWDSESQGIEFWEALKTAARARLTETELGSVLTGTAGNGHSMTFSLPAAGRGLSPHEVAEVLGEMIDLFEGSDADLQSAGITDPSDGQIFTEMMDRLQPVRKMAPSSFLNLRCNP